MEAIFSRTPPNPTLEGILPYPEPGEGLVIEDILTQSYMTTWYQLGYAALAREENLDTVKGASVKPPEVRVDRAMNLGPTELAVIAKGMIEEAQKLTGRQENADVPLWRLKRAEYLVAVALRLAPVAKHE
jgi:hypothetical protein